MTDAAHREMQEETGLSARSLTLLSVATIPMPGGPVLDIEFLAHDVTGEPRRREPDKVEGWGWFGLEALPAPLFPPVSLALEAFRAGVVLHRL